MEDDSRWYPHHFLKTSLELISKCSQTFFLQLSMVALQMGPRNFFNLSSNVYFFNFLPATNRWWTDLWIKASLILSQINLQEGQTVLVVKLLLQLKMFVCCLLCHSWRIWHRHQDNQSFTCQTAGTELNKNQSH